MVFLPVWTRGSRRIWRPLDTASIPVYVPPPMEKARRKRKNIPPPPKVTSPVRKSVWILLGHGADLADVGRMP